MQVNSLPLARLGLFKTPNCGKVPRDGGIKGVAFAGDTENREISTKLLISWHLEKVPMNMCNRPFLFYLFCFSKADQLFPQGFPQVLLWSLRVDKLRLTLIDRLLMCVSLSNSGG